MSEITTYKPPEAATIQPCKICRGTGNVQCPNQLCTHWCPCTVCNGTGKVEVYEDWSQGFEEEKVRPADFEPVKLGKPIVKVRAKRRERNDNFKKG